MNKASLFIFSLLLLLVCHAYGQKGNTNSESSKLINKKDSLEVLCLNYFEKKINRKLPFLLHIVSWNNYDKFHYGIFAFSSPLKQKGFKYQLLPSYSFNSKKINYSANLTYVLTLFDENIAARIERGIQPDKFIGDEVGIILQGTFILSLLKDKNYSIYGLPYLDEEINIPTLIDAKGFSLFNNNKKELCLDFIKYILKNGDAFCINNIKVPLYDSLKVPEELKRLYKIHESGVYFTKNPSLQGIYKKVMKQTLQAIYSGSISIDEGLDSAQEFAEKNW